MNSEMQLRDFDRSSVEAGKQRHGIWKAKNWAEGKHSRRDESKRCIPKAVSAPAMQPGEPHDAKTEGQAGGRRADGSYF